MENHPEYSSHPIDCYHHTVLYFRFDIFCSMISDVSGVYPINMYFLKQISKIAIKTILVILD